MRKKLFILSAILLFLTLAVSVQAVGTPPAAEGKPLLYDEAGVLPTDNDFAAVEAELTAVSDRLNADIVVLTVRSLGAYGYTDGDTGCTECADDFFDRNGYGRGEDRDGVVLLLAVEDRQFTVSAFGYGTTAVTDNGVDWLCDKIVNDLSAGNYARAFVDYADSVEYLFGLAREGNAFNGDSAAVTGISSAAAGGSGIIPPVVGSKQYLYIEDGVNILTEEQKQELSARLEQLSNRYNIDIAIAVFSSMVPYRFTDEVDFADRYYEDNGFGRGPDRSGIVLVRVMDERFYIISTAGSCEVTMNDNEGMDYYTSDSAGLIPALRRDDYYSAFRSFTDATEYLLSYEQENGYAYGDEPVEKFSLLRTIGSALTGLLGGLIPVSGMKSQLKTVRQQHGARSYAKADSLNVTNANDFFIGRHVSRTRIETERSSGGGGGHFSSGGMHHGGTSGRA